MIAGALSLGLWLVSGGALADGTPGRAGAAETTRSWIWEAGGRYWYSTGNTSWNHDASGIAPVFGNPTSVLSYDDLKAHSGEFFFRGDHRSGVFIKGYVGGGKIIDGSLDDEDFLVGQVKFSDTFSSVDSGSLRYFSADLGFAYDSRTRSAGMKDYPDARGFRLGGFVGYHYWNEKANAFGVRCNPDDFGGAACGPPGFVAVPFSTAVISNEALWHGFRFGLNGEVYLTPRFKISGEVAWIPYARLSNEDSHHLRADLGPVPNIVHSSVGDGIALEGVLSYDLTDRFTIGVGARYWHFEAEGGTVVFAAQTPFPANATLNKFESERYGAFVQGSLKF